jgi:hypothetical protein
MIAWCRALVIVLACLSSATQAGAHRLATTTVSVVETRPGLIDVTVEAEADALIEKLEALAGVLVSNPPVTNTDRRARLESLFPTLRAHIEVRVSGTPLELSLRDMLVDDTAQVAIHLTATTSPGPHTCTWRSTFVFGAYQLTIKSGDRGDVVQWLQGPQMSDPIALEPIAEARASALRFLDSRISHGLAMGALVAFVLGRRRRGQRRPAG